MNVLFDSKNLGPLNLEGHIIHPLADFEKSVFAFVALGQGGGKIAVDLNRVGNYVSLFNTASEDLIDAESKLKEIGNGKYKITRFSGFDGAKKDRSIGLKAVRASINILENELLADMNLHNADFVWVIAALGGGTGSGSISDVVKIIAKLIRNNQKRLGYEENDQYILNEGKPTVGVIAVIPDDSSGHQIKLNAAQALQELITLQTDGDLGAILLVDNQKLIESAQQNIDSKEKWHVRGNATITELFTEIAITSSIPAEEAFDKSELLDIFSEPGFLSLTKADLSVAEIIDVNHEVNKLFTSEIFADGYKLNEAIISSMLFIKPEKNNNVSPLDELKLRHAFSDIVSNVRYIHFGSYDVRTTHKYHEVLQHIAKNQTIEKSTRSLLYSLTIFKNPPERILNMTKNALEKKQATETSLQNAISDFSGLSIQSNSTAPLKRKEGSTSLQDLLGTKSSTTSNIRITDILGLK